MSAVTEVPISPLPIERFRGVIDDEQYQRVSREIDQARDYFAGHVLWNVNSTARGGGVAEMLRSLLAYVRGIGVDARWMVISGDPDFFRITKRLHNHLHGAPGDGGLLGPAEREHYERVLAANGRELRDQVGRGDVVILHDPQTAGLVPLLAERGVRILWRCHVGADVASDVATGAWEFLRPYVCAADACIFSRRSFVWEGIEPGSAWIVPPSIDAFSAKNCALDDAVVTGILDAAGVVRVSGAQGGEFQRPDGTSGRVQHQATFAGDARIDPRSRLVVQVSRWDRLKDPVGVIRGFVEHSGSPDGVELVVAGPAVDAVSDDPEGAEVLAEATEQWRAYPEASRRRVHLVCLPMVDGEENAIIVNALQRRAIIAVQKSLAEGFGLTVAEAMWKARPVVASRIGGIQDQIEDGVTGVLLDDPNDLRAFGQSVARLLDDPARRARMGEEAQRRVRSLFLGPRHLSQYFELLAGTAPQPSL